MVKVSQDEDSEEQVSGICEAIWESGVDGVIVGNTTTRRPDPLPMGYNLPPKEAAAMLEQGGYSGPQLFERMVSLVKRYRQKLDEGSMPKPSPPKPTKGSAKPLSPPDPPQHPPAQHIPDISAKIDATVARDSANLKPDIAEAEASSKSQPFIRIPARNNHSTSETADSDASPALSSSTHIDQLPPASADSASASASPPPSSSASLTTPLASQKRKVIFATGGITNGKQALEVLDAGASVAMVYTAVSLPT